jgi:hypothetical protein
MISWLSCRNRELVDVSKPLHEGMDFTPNTISLTQELLHNRTTNAPNSAGNENMQTRQLKK